MGNTVFYRQVQQDASKIGWKDIFSDYKKKHTREDFEYTLAAGTSLNAASEENMLQKWRKPWLFYPLLKWGIALIIVLYIVYYGLTISGIGVTVPAIDQMTIIIPPLITPVILMVLFWEMNIPRNITLYELLVVWLIGGLVSIASANVLFNYIPDDLPICIQAPLAEEPAKLIAGFLIILFFSKNKKIYGITGFIIGAAVGAGFGAFESVQYAFSAAQQITDVVQLETGELLGVVGTSMNSDVLFSQILRAVLAVGGHTLFCAPYAAELAGNTTDGKITVRSIFNIDFIIAFIISCLLHGLWDLDIIEIPGGVIGHYIYLAILIILIWIEGIRILRKCLNQVVQIGAKESGGTALEHGAGVGYTTAVSAMDKQAIHDHGSAETGLKQTDQKSIEVGNVITGRSNATSIRVICNSGELKGLQWETDGHKSLVVGRGDGCEVHFSPAAKGVSGRHCSIQLTQFGWTVKDLGSSYGTFVSGGKKVLPGTDIRLHDGDIISLGGNENTLMIRM